jgi:hypothetical protein
MGKNLIDVVEEIVGKRCLFETIEGAYRTEVVHHVTCRTFKYGDINIDYPMKFCFDAVETDFVHINSLKSVKVL